MFFDFIITAKVQYSGYVNADSKEEAMKLIMSGDWNDAEDVGFVQVESIDDIEEIKT